jgi:RNA polymerase sigma-54 factor
MDMLYMPMMDLQQHLKQELLVNPFLELVEPEEEESARRRRRNPKRKRKKPEKEQEIDWEEISSTLRRGRGQAAFEQQEYLEPIAVESPTSSIISRAAEPAHAEPRQATAG